MRIRLKQVISDVINYFVNWVEVAFFELPEAMYNMKLKC